MGVPFLTLTVCREVFSHFKLEYNPKAATSHTVYILLHCLHVLHYRDYPVCDYLREREREREREGIYRVG